MGTRRATIRTRQRNTTTRRSQISNTPQRDKGSTTTAFAAQRHNSHNIQPDQDRYPGILPVNISIHADAGSDRHYNKQQPRPNTKGHWSNVGKGKGGKGKGRVKEKAARVTTTTRPRKPFQRRNERLRLQQRKSKTRTNRSKREQGTRHVCCQDT